MQLAAKFAPSLVGKLTGSDKAEQIAEKVIGFAKEVTGEESPENAVKVLDANPEMALKFQQALYTYQLGLEQEYTKQIEAVNRTMQTEVISGKGLTAFWRPFNGILFGCTLFLDYVGSQIILALAESTFVWQHIPAGVYMLWTGVLGVAAVSRGKEKITNIRTTAALNGTALGNLELLKEFGKGILRK